MAKGIASQVRVLLSLQTFARVAMPKKTQKTAAVAIFGRYFQR
jgi:hypothetical protein